MRYIKLFEKYNPVDSEDIEYILEGYLHEGKVELYKSDYYRIFLLENTTHYNSAIKELKSHDLEYDSIAINGTDGEYGFIFTYISEDITNYLDEKFSKLTPLKNSLGNYIYYSDSLYATNRTYYSIKRKDFYIDFYKIWQPFEEAFNLEHIISGIFTKWYVVNNLHSDCTRTCLNCLDHAF